MDIIKRIKFSFLVGTVFLVMALGVICEGETNGEKKLPALPAMIPGSWLAKSSHPRLFCTSEELAAARLTVRDTKRGQEYIEKQKKLCERFVVLADERLADLVPAPYSKIVYGLGMNLDPVDGKRMKWAGWDHPFEVRDHKGNIYPNQDWPDKGDGIVDPATNKRYYFIAQANGHILKQLEQKVLPALADVYALEGSQKHAHAAAVLLDAIAALYPTNRRGPLDYPTLKTDYDKGGRLNRPYYQVARGLMNYVTVIDLIAASGELEQQSLHTDEKSIRENLAKNLLWDGGMYCYENAVKGTMLHNGHADYMRGAAMCGIMLDTRELAEPMFKGRVSMQAMLDINIDRNGFYYETSPSYASHATHLYVTIADLMLAARNLGWKDVPDSFAEPAMELFLGDFFNRREVGGHVPPIGDDGPDRFMHDPMLRNTNGKTVHSHRFIGRQIDSAWIRLVRSRSKEQKESAAQLLRDSYGTEKISPPADRWSIYHIGQRELELIQVQQPDIKHFDTASTFYGAKGLALLRGGEGSKRYGCQLYFGPVNNHGHYEAMTWTFFAKGAEWSFDSGYFNKQYRFGWNTQTVAHQAMTIGGASYDWTDGSGVMLAWQDDAEVQWAMGSHPDAYREQGATRYERLIGQVHNSATGELGYWLDVGRVSGGNIRDDSFHTQMLDVALDIELPEPLPNRPSLYGDENFGKMLNENGALKSYEDKGFYWHPPGYGYGFLGEPQEVIMPDAVRVIMSNPGFAKEFGGIIIADLTGSSRRSLIRVQGPVKSHTISVPFILRRDTGDEPSIFAKVVQVVDTIEDDFVKGIKEVKVIAGSSEAVVGAWCITLANGNRDLWYVGDVKHPATVRLESEFLPTVTTNGLVSFVRFDKEGKVLKAHASKAGRLDVARKSYLKGYAELKGKIRKVYKVDNGTAFDVSWDDYSQGQYEGRAAITKPDFGQAATWRVKKIDGKRVLLYDVKPSMGITEFVPIDGKEGWYKMATTISRFFASGKKESKEFAVGKAVYRKDRFIGRITDLSEEGTNVRIQLEGVDIKAKRSFIGSVYEAGPGDEITVPLNLSL